MFKHSINYSNINSDLKPNENPDEIFRAIQEGKLTQLHRVLQVAACSAIIFMIFRWSRGAGQTGDAARELLQSGWARMDPAARSCGARGEEDPRDYLLRLFTTHLPWLIPWDPNICLGFTASNPGAAQCRTLNGETPLFLAVVRGLRENATFLLQNGSSPDLQNDEQDSPLVAGTAPPDCAPRSSLSLKFFVSIGSYSEWSVRLGHTVASL